MQNWKAPDKELSLENDAVSVSPINVTHDLQELFNAASIESNRGVDLFTYHPVGPFVTVEDFKAYLETKSKQPDDIGYKVFSKRLGKTVGAAHLMNIKEAHGCIEVGSIWYSKEAQRTEINTNTMFLLFSHVFEDLKYRRLEWKCDNNNEPSKKAALRLGFSYEGLFRNHLWIKNRNRDTAWFSIIDSEWSRVKQVFVTVLLR